MVIIVYVNKSSEREKIRTGCQQGTFSPEKQFLLPEKILIINGGILGK